LPRFWLQEIVEELDNTTTNTVRARTTVAIDVDREKMQATSPDDGDADVSKGGSLDDLLAAEDQFVVRRPLPMTRYRPQDRVLGRDRIGSDIDGDAPVRPPSAGSVRNGGAAPRQPLEQPRDGAQWLKLFRTRTREDVYGAVDTITCDSLDLVEYASQRPYTHVSCVRVCGFVLNSERARRRWAKLVCGMRRFAMFN